jgi:hypothetical protein
VFALEDLGFRFSFVAEHRNIGRVLLLFSIVCILGVNLMATVIPLHMSKGKDYDRAGALDQIAPKGSIIYTEFGVQQNLRYHFDRVEVFDHVELLLNFYTEKTAFELNELSPWLPVAVHWDHLLPGYTLQGFSGIRNPDLWLGYLDWLFEIEVGPGEEAKGCRDWVFWPAGLDTFVLLGPERVSVGGWSDFFSRLDQAQPGFTGGEKGPGPFGRWYQKWGRVPATLWPGG